MPNSQIKSLTVDGVTYDIVDKTSGYITSYTETDPIFSASVAAGITSTDISNWNNKVKKSGDRMSGDLTFNEGKGIAFDCDEVTPILKGDGYALGDTGNYIGIIQFSSKTQVTNLQVPSNSISTNSDVVNKKYVDDAIANLPEPMLFKGTVGTGGTITSLPAAAAANEGYTYKVITALSTPVAAKVGDTVISNGNTWTVIPSGDEPSGTVTSIGLSNATNGGLTISDSPITSSGSITVGHSNVLTSAQTTQALYPIKIDKNGHISAYGTAISVTGSATTGVTIADHGTTSVGSASNWSAGSASSWTFEEKTIPNVTAAGSGSASLTFTMDTTDTKKLKIAFSHTHTAPTIGTAIKVQSKSGGSNSTAPSLTVTPTTVVTGKTHTVTDSGHTHTI